MEEIVLLENPRRKKSRKRRTTRKGKMPAGLKRYLAAKRAAKKNPRRKRTGSSAVQVHSSTGKLIYPIKRRTTVKHKRTSRRRYRHNPPMSLGGITSGIGSTIKPALVGAAVIGINKAISNQVAGMIGVSKDNKTLVSLAVALVGLPLVGRMTKQPWLQKGAEIAAAVEIFEAGRKYLPASIQAYLGDYGYPSTTPVQTSIEGDSVGASVRRVVDPGIRYIPAWN